MFYMFFLLKCKLQIKSAPFSANHDALRLKPGAAVASLCQQIVLIEMNE